MSEEVMIDVVSFTDEDGKEFEMELIDEFDYKGETFVVLAELNEDDECGEDCACEGHADGEECDCEDTEDSLYIMKVSRVNGEEEFLPVEEAMLQELISVVEERLLADEDPE